MVDGYTRTNDNLWTFKMNQSAGHNVQGLMLRGPACMLNAAALELHGDKQIAYMLLIIDEISRELA